MIIKKLEIISFGKFTNKILEFSNGFNIVFGNNESGKSTIINFIYAMFYGFGDNRGKTLSLREKYTPWSGGVCEGRITLLTDVGTNICIYRKAGNAKKYDLLRVYDADTGEEYHKTPEEIIGVGADTFFKTLCIRQLSSVFEGNNDEITQKLSNISAGGDETINYEKAQKILETVRREIQPQRGKGGELSAITNKIAEIEKSQFSANRMKTELQSVEVLISQTHKEVALLKERAEKLRERDCTTKIAHLQGRLEEMQKHSSAKGSIPFFLTGILSLLLFGVGSFLSLDYSFILLPVSILFLVTGFIKRNNSANNNIKSIEAELNKLSMEKEIFDKDNESLKRALHESEKKLGNLKTRKESLSLSLTNDEISPEKFIDKKKKLEAKLHAVTVSMEALRRAHEKMQKNFTPALNKKAAEYLRRISGGKYSSIFCDKEFGVMIETDLPRESGFFSGGTVDQLYLSVRLALVDMLYQDSSCTILLDQPFLQYDKIRKENAVKLLESLPLTRQILLFTSDESLNSTNKTTEILT